MPHLPRPGDDEDALAVFFAAARAAEDGGPRTALLSAILADAAEVSAARAAPARPAAAPPRRAGLLAPIGGWRGLAALGACAVFGFWVGLAGDLGLDGARLTTAASSSDSAGDGVDAFFDYASLEQ